MIRPELDFYAPPINFNAVNVERRNKQRTNIYAWRAAATAAVEDNNNTTNNYCAGGKTQSASGNVTSKEKFMPGSLRTAEQNRQHELEVNGYWPNGAVMMPDRRRQWKMSGFDFTQTQKELQSSLFNKTHLSIKEDKSLSKHEKHKHKNSQIKNKTNGSDSKDKLQMNNTYFHDTITFYKPSTSSNTHTDAEYHENETSHILPLLSRMRQEQLSSGNKTNKLNKLNASSCTLLALTCNSAELKEMCLNGTITNNKATKRNGDIDGEKSINENNNNCKITITESKKQEEQHENQKNYNDRQWVRRLGPVLESKYKCDQVVDEFCKTLNYTSADFTQITEKNEMNDENSKMYAAAAARTEKAAPISLSTAELAYTLRPKYTQAHSHSRKANLQNQEEKEESEQEGQEGQNAFFANTYDGNRRDTNQFMLSGRNWNRTMYNNFSNTNCSSFDDNNNSTKQTKKYENELAQSHLQVNNRNKTISNNTMYLRQLHLLPTEAKLMRLYAVNVPTSMQSSDLSMVRRQEPPRLGVKITLS